MRHSRGDTKSDAKNSSIPRIRPRFYNRVRSPQSGLFPALSPAAHRHGSYVSVCEGSERQQGGQLTYTLHSFRFCAESVLTAVDRAGSTATCVPQSTRRRVDPSLRTLDQPQRSQPPPPESAHPTICATRWSATSRVRITSPWAGRAGNRRGAAEPAEQTEGEGAVVVRDGAPEWQSPLAGAASRGHLLAEAEIGRR